MSLEARQLQVRFGAVQALTLDHLILEDGEKVGLRGANGSGKSTLLRVLAGLIPASSGTLTGLPPRGAVVLVHQEPHFFRGSVLQNMRYALHLAGRPLTEAEGWIQRAQAGHLSHQPAHTLSTGERRRLAIARALSVHPRMLLLDEPFAGVDARHRTIIHHELSGYQGTLLVAGPDEDPVALDRIIHLTSSRLKS